MNEVFDYGTGVPYTHEDLEVLFSGVVARRREEPSCTVCRWFDAGIERALPWTGNLRQVGRVRKVLSFDGTDVARRFRDVPLSSR